MNVTTPRTGFDGANHPVFALLKALGPSVVTGVILFLAYFILPFTSKLTTYAVLWFGAGLTAVAVLLVWQVQAVRSSPRPVVRSFGIVTVTLPLFLVVFSVTYFLMARADPSAWTEHLTKLDAFYFTVTTFATVGFGDIAPVSSAARTVVIIQIAGNLLVVGVIARIVVAAVREGLARRAPGETDDQS
jgi:hypothetical protein